jgi:biopolymer transport protein ExbB/TolQ
MSSMIKNLLALIISIVAVHLLYIGYIRPDATLILKEAKEAGLSAPRNIVVILKDYEQEICLILMCWGAFLIVSKCIEIMKYKYLFNVDLIEDSVNDSSELSSVLKALNNLSFKIKDTPLVRTLMSSIRRYLITKNVQDTSDAIESSVEILALSQEAQNSMIRYLIWAIPSIGFIGTVRGIGQALSQADQALEGDIAGMTDSLGVAFNSTFVALLISIGLMFLLHQLQRLQDGLVVDTQKYCESFLLDRISKLGDP